MTVPLPPVWILLSSPRPPSMFQTKQTGSFMFHQAREPPGVCTELKTSTPAGTKELFPNLDAAQDPHLGPLCMVAGHPGVGTWSGSSREPGSGGTSLWQPQTGTPIAAFTLSRVLVSHLIGVKPTTESHQCLLFLSSSFRLHRCRVFRPWQCSGNLPAQWLWGAQVGLWSGHHPGWYQRHVGICGQKADP